MGDARSVDIDNDDSVTIPVRGDALRPSAGRPPTSASRRAIPRETSSRATKSEREAGGEAARRLRAAPSSRSRRQTRAATRRRRQQGRHRDRPHRRRGRAPGPRTRRCTRTIRTPPTTASRTSTCSSRASRTTDAARARRHPLLLDRAQLPAARAVHLVRPRHARVERPRRDRRRVRRSTTAGHVVGRSRRVATGPSSAPRARGACIGVGRHDVAAAAPRRSAATTSSSPSTSAPSRGGRWRRRSARTPRASDIERWLQDMRRVVVPLRAGATCRSVGIDLSLRSPGSR